MKKRFYIIASITLIIIIFGVFSYRYYFVFGEGTKAGTMNYFMRKGYVFKTFEGRLIQSGIRSSEKGSIQSNEFMFSVTDPHVAKVLEDNAGAFVELHYQEYLHTIPWRGVSRFVVDGVKRVQKKDNSGGISEL